MFLTLVILAGLGADQAPRKDLILYYRRACAECHGADGGARSAAGFRLPGRNLADPRWQARTEDAEMVRAILRGKREMPAFGASLSEEEAQRLVRDVIRPMATHRR